MTPSRQATEASETELTEAQRSAADAEALVESLAEQVRNGDETVGPDDIEAARKLSGFAKLRHEAAKRKLAKAREAARLAAAQQLHDDVHAYSDAIADQLRARLQDVAAANQAFTDAVEAHKGKVLDMVRRAHELDIPEHDGLPMPPAEHGHVAIPKAGGAIRAGLLELGILGAPKTYLTQLADRPDQTAELIGGVAHSAAHTHPGREASLTWYQGQGGQIFGAGKPYTAEDAKRLGLRKLTDQEAFG